MLRTTFQCAQRHVSGASRTGTLVSRLLSPNVTFGIIHDSRSCGRDALTRQKRYFAFQSCRQNVQSNTLPGYQYRHLSQTESKSGSSFRLLEVLEGSDKAPLRCRLLETDLLTAPQYETISYRWGDVTNKETIICNEALLNIPKALGNALRGIRYAQQSRLIWADAACINQLDVHEKEQQVQLMRAIYSRSQRTLIWLSDELDLKITWAAKVPILLSLRWFRRREKPENIPNLRFHNYRTGIDTLVSTLSSEGYLAYVNILRNPWFERAWVVQEVAVSKNPTIIWNGHEIPWADAVNGLEYISNLKWGMAFMPTLQHISSIEYERRRYQSKQGDLLSMLQRHQRCLATDNRDKVFAFAGLTHSLPQDFKISYTSSVEDVYHSLAKAILQADRSLPLLSQPAAPQMSNSRDLPSWVPDWSHTRLSIVSHSWGLQALSLAQKLSPEIDGQPVAFAAAPKVVELPTFTPDGRTLHVEGQIFDLIEEVGDRFDGVELPPPTTSVRGIVKEWIYSSKSYLKAQRALMNWEALADIRTEAKSYSPTGESMIDAYWKTVSAGDYPHVNGSRIEIGIWDRINRTTRRLKRLRFGLVVLPYSIMVAVWQVLTKGPTFKFHLQSHYTLHRRLARTTRGYLALVVDGVAVGDAVVLLKGSKVPFVLRSMNNRNSWRIMGDSYVHGIMFGEGWDEGKCIQLLLR